MVACGYTHPPVSIQDSVLPSIQGMPGLSKSNVVVKKGSICCAFQECLANNSCQAFLECLAYLIGGQVKIANYLLVFLNNPYL
jgi:hypothetical protein